MPPRRADDDDDDDGGRYHPTQVGRTRSCGKRVFSGTRLMVLREGDDDKALRPRPAAEAEVLLLGEVGVVVVTVTAAALWRRGAEDERVRPALATTPPANAGGGDTGCGWWCRGGE